MRVDAKGYRFELSPASETRAQVRWWPESDADASRTRSLDISPTRIGPAAPDAACRDRVHDPFEDFVALTFVRFDPEVRGPTWRGEAVSGDGQTCATPGRCCAPLACGTMPENEPSTGAPAPSCQLGHWREERDPPTSETGPLTLRSSWENGRTGPQSTRTTRFVDFNATAGRTLRSRVQIEFGDGRDARDIEIVALDRCNGIQPLVGD